MNNIKKIGMLAALLGMSCVQGALIKQGNGFLAEPKTLAQAGCDIEEVL